MRQRRSDGGYLPRAVCLRHNSEANVGYADGHLGDTRDRMGMLMRSSIDVYIDAEGRNQVTTK